VSAGRGRPFSLTSLASSLKTRHRRGGRAREIKKSATSNEKFTTEIKARGKTSGIGKDVEETPPSPEVKRGLQRLLPSHWLQFQIKNNKTSGSNFVCLKLRVCTTVCRRNLASVGTTNRRTSGKAAKKSRKESSVTFFATKALALGPKRSLLRRNRSGGGGDYMIQRASKAADVGSSETEEDQTQSRRKRQQHPAQTGFEAGPQ